jgi:hypothetical protein
MLIERGIFMTDSETRPHLMPARIELIAYNPKSTSQRFLIVASGAIGNRAHIDPKARSYARGTSILYVGVYNQQLLSYTAWREQDYDYYKSVGATALMSMHGLGKDYIVIYHVPGSSLSRDYLQTHIRTGR